MGPADISDMSSTTNNQVLNLPKLRSNGSNWSTYQERILNYITSKGLKWHLLDTVKKPVELREQDGLFYKGIKPDPLTEEEIEEHEGEEDKYKQ